ncbi:hypothetical protein AB833_08975 [Chromatiales bacterium (ex Bugula neritina AB1)]|nr:hypothetical protein AB833_08975 [Chromatiales bacterium (ex Bugula neritina AB1)]
MTTIAEQLHKSEYVEIPPEVKIDALKSAGMQRLVSSDFSAQIVTVSMKSAPASVLLDFDARAREELDQYNDIAVYEGGLGSDLVFARLGHRNATSMFATLTLALAAITVLLGVFFKSWKLCVTGLVCNAMPLIIVYGIWAIAGGYNSLGCAVVMGMIMGIIVDDTVHLLYRYRMQENSQTTRVAVSRARQQQVTNMLADTAPALLVSSISLIAGLAVGMFSDFRPIRELAVLSLAVIFVATLTDLLLLPALLGLSRRKSPI